MEQTFLVGLDLGQAQDFSVLVILQRILGDMTAPPTCVSYALRFLKRFPLRTPYPDIIDGVRMVVETEQLANKCVLLVDATGVGKPIVDVLQRAKLPVKLVPVVITGGSVVVRDGNRYNVPKRFLATAVKILLDGRRLRISTQLAQHELLTKELEAFRVKINTKTANDSYEAWREGDHDDLVLSVALCCWYAERVFLLKPVIKPPIPKLRLTR